METGFVGMSVKSSPWDSRSPVASVLRLPGRVTLVEGQTFCISGAPAAGRADADVVVLRQRHVCAGMRERLTVTNHGLEPVPVLLELFCGVDFADVFEVKPAPTIGARRSHVWAPDTADRLRAVADEVVCVIRPSGFQAVGEWYDCLTAR